ncbi:MAG: EamA family transporter [Acidobacteriota bacterium]
MSPREKNLAIAAWITVCVVWGTTYLGIRVALESVPVSLVAGLRWTVAGLLLLAALPAFGQRVPPRALWGRIAVLAFLMTVMGNGLVVWAQQYVASGLAAVFVAANPFWNAGVEALLPRGERLTARTLIGLAVGFSGIVLLVWPELAVEGGGGRSFLLGVIALQLACLGWALGTSYTKRTAVSADPAGTSALQMLFGGLMFMALAAANGDFARLTFTARSATAMLYLTLVGSIVGYSSYVYALRYLPVSTVSLYAYVNPVIAVVLGTLLLAEPFSARIPMAAALVFSGIAVVRMRRSTFREGPISRLAWGAPKK